MDHSSGLKAIAGLGLLAIALYTGFAQVPPWSILLLAIPFTAAYIHGKWYLWADLLRYWNGKLLRSLLVTYLIQAIVVAIFYLLGSGVVRLLGR